MPPGERRTRSFQEALADVDKQLGTVSDVLGQPRPDLALVKRRIANCRSMLAGLAEHPAGGTSGSRRRPRGDGIGAYALVESEGVTYLAERRVGHASDFLVPRALVDEVAAAIERPKKPIGFREIETTLEGSEQPATWKIRVALRFLGHHQVVRRKDARYELTDPTALSERLETLWRSLEGNNEKLP